MPINKEKLKALAKRINETSNADFVKRLLDKKRESIKNPDGTVSTHELGYVTEGDHAVVFPDIQSTENGLVRFPYPESYDRAVERGDTVHMSVPDAKLFTEHYKEVYPGFDYSAGGQIHIKESKKGTFTAAAKAHGKSVQAFASQVLANKDNYSPAMVKKANFARNASKWHSDGGPISFAVPSLLLSGKIKKRYLRDYINNGAVTGYPMSLGSWAEYIISPYADTRFSSEKGKDYDMARRAIMSKYTGVTDGLDFNPDDYIEESPYKPSNAKDPNAKYYRPKSNGEEYHGAIFNAVAGNYKVDKGEDENGRYASFYDVWDLAPFSARSGSNEIRDTSPVELYDRVYEKDDPFSYYMYFPEDRPKRNKKKVEYKKLEFSHGGPISEAMNNGKLDVIRAAINNVKNRKINKFDRGGENDRIPMAVDSKWNLIDTIEPSVVTAKLPSKFHGSQAAARRYAEGYKFGKRVAGARDAVIRDIMPNLDYLFIDESLPEYEKNKRMAEMLMRYSGGITSPIDAAMMKVSPSRMLMTLGELNIDKPVYSGEMTPKQYLDSSNYSNFAGVGRKDYIGLDVPISDARGAFQANDLTREANNDFVSAFFNEEMPLENTDMIEQYNLHPFYKKLFGNHYPVLFSTTPHVYQTHPDTLSVADRLNEIVNNTTNYNYRGVSTDNDGEHRPWVIPGNWPYYYDAGNNTRVDVELDGVKYSKDNDVFDVENINNWPARPFTSFITEYGKPYIVSTPWYVSTPYYERRSE